MESAQVEPGRTASYPTASRNVCRCHQSTQVDRVGAVSFVRRPVSRQRRSLAQLRLLNPSLLRCPGLSDWRQRDRNLRCLKSVSFLFDLGSKLQQLLSVRSDEGL